MRSCVENLVLRKKVSLMFEFYKYILYLFHPTDKLLNGVKFKNLKTVMICIPLLLAYLISYKR